VHLLWKQSLSFPLPQIKHSHELLFTAKALQDKFANILNTWHKTLERFESVVNLFMTVLRMRRELNISNCFLNLCQVLEAYHRIKSNETYIDQDKYDMLLDSIISTVPSDHREHIKQRLRYGNEIGLRKRLKSIYDMLPEKIKGRIPNRNDFIGKVVDTRNYFTHYDPKSKQNSLVENEIVPVETILFVICRALFFIESGIEDSVIGDKLCNFDMPQIVSYAGQD
jgi:hypothetical protein